MDFIMIWLTGTIKPCPKWRRTCSLDVPSSNLIWHELHGGCPCRKQRLLTLPGAHESTPRFFDGVHVVHLFFFVSVFFVRFGLVFVVLRSLSVLLHFPFSSNIPLVFLDTFDNLELLGYYYVAKVYDKNCFFSK